MDEFHEKLRRFFTIIKFILGGHLCLIIAIPVDTFVFFRNLYTKPHDADEEV